MKKFFSSIRKDRQLLPQIIFVFAAFFVMVLVGSILGGRIIDRNVESYGREVVSTAGEMINSYMEEYNLLLSDIGFSLIQLDEHGAGADEMEEELVAWTERLRYMDEKYVDFNGFYGVFRGAFITGIGWEPLNPNSPDYLPDYRPYERPWHIGALAANGDIHITNPYVDANSGEIVMTVSQMLFGSDGHFVGIISMDLFFSKVKEIVDGLSLLDKGYGVLLDSDRNIVVTYHSNVGVYFDDIDEGHAEIGASLDAGEEIVHHTIFSYGEQYVVFFRQIPIGWYVGVASPRDNYYSDRNQMALTLSIVGLLMALPLCGMLVYLHIKRARADEANMLKSSFLAKMSHEMRTPMNAIIGMSELLQGEPLNNSQKSYANQINASAQSLLSLIDELLDLSKLEVEGAPKTEPADDTDGAQQKTAANYVPDFAAPEARVLVVDDTEVNLKVAAGLLRNLFKLNVTVAESGFEAIELVRENEYDVIFMDHMMPEMDGLETVREIRKLGGRHKSQKFVALTANAIAGVREMFLANGFDGFLLKPIDTSELGSVLREVLPGEKIVKCEPPKEIAGQTCNGGSESSSSDFLNALGKVDAINTEIALSRVSGLEEMLVETVELFYSKLQGECEFLEKSLAGGDLQGFAIKVHGLKSSLSAIGAMELSEAAFALEKASKSGDEEFCTANLPDLLEKLTVLHTGLTDVFSNTSDAGGVESGEKTAGSPELLGEKVRTVITACEDFDDSTALEALDELLAFDFGDDKNAALKTAKGAIKDFDYDNAIEVLNEIVGGE